MHKDKRARAFCQRFNFHQKWSYGRVPSQFFTQIFYEPMVLISKRRLKPILLVIVLLLTVSLVVNGVVQFQLNKEIKYYKNFFQKKKDGLSDIYDPLNIKEIPYETINQLYDQRKVREEKNEEPIRWDKFAYVNYVTENGYLCNTVLQFKKLKQAGTKAKLLLLISSDLLDSDALNADETRHLLDTLKGIAPDQVIVKPVESIVKLRDYTPWNKSLTKLLVFNQTEFDRIVYLDNDATVNDQMDELFFLPSYIKFAAPLAYWFLTDNDLVDAYREVKEEEKWQINLNTYIKKLGIRIGKGMQIYNHLPNLPPSLFLNSKNVAQEIIQSTSSASPLFNFRNGGKNKIKLASNLMVIIPSQETFQSILNVALPKAILKKEYYDMDLINEQLYDLKKIIYYQFKLFRKLKEHFVPEVLVLPFAKYGLLTGSIKKREHYKLLKNDVLGYKRLDENGEDIKQDLQTVLGSCKYIHYSDYPLGKPWYYGSVKEFECTVDLKKSENIEDDERACKTWNFIYEDYFEERKACFF